MPGAVVNSPLAETGPEEGMPRVSRKRRTVEPVSETLPDKRVRIPARDPDGNEYNTAGAARAARGTRTRTSRSNGATCSTGARTTTAARGTGAKATRGGTKAARGKGA